MNNSSTLDENFIAQIHAVTGFEIERAGISSIRNPLTGRITHLDTARQRSEYIQRTETQLSRARLFENGISGQDFREVENNSAFGLGTFEQTILYDVPVDRMALNWQKMLTEFCTHVGVSSTSLLRLSAQLENDTAGGLWVSEKPQTITELRKKGMLFSLRRESGVLYLNMKRLKIQVISPPSGAVCRGLIDVPTFAKGHKKAIALIINNDQLCGQRALLYCMSTDGARKHLLKPTRAAAATKKAEEFAKRLGIEREMKFDDFSKFCDLEPDWGVVIFHGFDSVCYACHEERGKIAYLLFTGNHYHVVRNPDGFDGGGNKRFCHRCLKFFERGYIDFHTCEALQHRCSHCNERFETANGLCQHRNQTTKDEKRGMVCKNCNHWAHSANCMEAHKCDGKTKLCLKCYKNYQLINRFTGDEEPHICGTRRCQCCQKMKPEDHRCFIQPVELSNAKRTYVAFDFECDIISTDHHMPSGVAWHVIGTDEDQISYIDGFDTLARFVTWVLQQKYTTFIAHNGKAYDFLLFDAELERQGGYKVEKTRAGTKIMRMRYKTLIFIDSCNHVQTSLEKLPKTFGLDVEIRKGFFPYKHPYSDYVGPIPLPGAFCYENWPDKKQREFFKWYDERKKLVWNHRKEQEAYCRNDVWILSESMRVYMESGKQLCGELNPLTKTTAAGFAQATYLLLDIPEDMLAVLKPDEAAMARVSLFGGRTDICNPIVELTDAQLKAGWRLKYEDFCSLYPTVMWDKVMPVGVPSTHGEIGGDLAAWLFDKVGFVTVDCEVPKDLIYPVLPTKRDGRLNFTCDNIVEGTFSIVEINAAIKRGYKITKIHKANTYQPSNELWQSYIRRFLRGKLASSGKPRDMDSFISECKIRYDIELEAGEITKNAGFRSICKLLLNSLWGKFCQRNLPKEKIMEAAEWHKLWKLHQAGKVEIKDFEEVDLGRKMLVRYMDYREKENNSFKTNVSVGAYVTAHARLMLLEKMELCGSRLIGHDTDSVWYLWRPNDPVLPTGEHLGDLTNELIEDGKEQLLIGAVGTGAKCYSMLKMFASVPCCDYPEAMKARMDAMLFASLNRSGAPVGKIGGCPHILSSIYSYLDPTFTCVKAKGIIMNAVNSKKVRYGTMRKIVLNTATVIADLQGPIMKRRKIGQGHCVIQTCREGEGAKRLRFTATKRKAVHPDHAHIYQPGFLLPAGHIHCEEN